MLDKTPVIRKQQRIITCERGKSMKSLVIAEKPSVARDIARVLHCSQKGNGTLEGKDYVVTWALGHLVTLADPEEYDKKYTKWDTFHSSHDAG